MQEDPEEDAMDVRGGGQDAKDRRVVGAGDDASDDEGEPYGKSRPVCCTHLSYFIPPSLL